MRALETASAEKASRMAMKTPVGPKVELLGQEPAEGNLQQPETEQIQSVGVQVSPAPLKADGHAHPDGVEREPEANDPQSAGSVREHLWIRAEDETIGFANTMKRRPTKPSAAVL
jgi:hypothetical protein